MRTRLISFFMAAATAVSVSAQRSPAERRAWNEPVEPFKIIGNIYYVGAAGVSAFLIRTNDGSILIDGGLPETAPRIAQSLRALDVDIRDVKYLLNSHGHFDHAGGLAELKRLSRATLLMSAPDAEAVAAGAQNMPAVKADRLLRDRETVTLGGTTLTAHLTPGHTKGCTTWTMKVNEGGRPYDVLFHCSTSVVDTLIGNKGYPDIVSDYLRTFARLQELKADVFLGAHPSFFNMDEKRRKLAMAGPNPFVDPSELRRFNDRSRRDFEAALARETASKRPL